METLKPREYILEVFADPASVKDIVKGILHTIFFHRYFPCIRPTTIEVLDLTLPAIDDVELSGPIESRVNSLVLHHLSPTSNSPNGAARGRIAVQFFERKRRKAGGGLWFGGLTGGKNEEEVCWEIWNVDVTIATPRTDSDRAKVRKAMEKMLHKAAFKIVSIVNKDRDHIPPITTSDSNPFPFQIVLNPKLDSWTSKLGRYY